MTGRFLGTVLALLVVITTSAYNRDVSWRVYIQGLRNQQAPLIDQALDACENPEPQAAADP